MAGVRYNNDIEKLYRDAIQQNIEKRNNCEKGSRNWEIYNSNIEKLEKDLKEHLSKPKTPKAEVKKIKEPENGNMDFKAAEEKFSEIIKISKKINPDIEKRNIPANEPEVKIQEQRTKKQKLKPSDISKIDKEINKLIEKAEMEIEAKYRGNKELNKKYDLAMKRYKSNKIEKDFFVEIDGKKVSGKYKTIQDYSEKEKDEETLNFSEYVKVLERFTKAKSLKELGIDYYEGSEFSYNKDKEYLKTDNYTYNEYKATRENLKTLGYFGRKSRLLELKKGQNIRNVVRTGINITGFVRNHTVVPVSNIIGEKVAVKVYSCSYKMISGDKNKVYKNRRTHRFEARKEYNLSQGKGYIKSVYQSIVKAREIDAEILDKKKKEIRREYGEYKKELLNAKNKTERKNIRKPQINTDAISLEIHNERNKKNVTRVITGIKAVAIAGISYVGPKISKSILDKTSHERIITTKSGGEDVIVQTQKWIQGKDTQILDREKLENLKISDLINAKDNTVSSFAGGVEDEVVKGNLQYIRGIAEKNLSMLDGNGVNISGLANSKIPGNLLNSSNNINVDTNILDLIAANRNQVSGVNTSKKEILDEILKSGKPEEQIAKLQEIFDKIHLSKSTSKSGVPTGWDSLGNEFSEIKQSLIKTVQKGGHWKTVTKTIKGETVEKILKVRENSKTAEKILKGVGNSLRAVRVMEVADLIYENVRRPKKREIGER